MTVRAVCVILNKAMKMGAFELEPSLSVVLKMAHSKALDHVAVTIRFAKNLLTFEREGGSPEEFEQITLGSLRKAAVDGNIDEGSFLCGAIAGMVNEIRPCKDIVETMFSQAEKLLGR